jgi:hypothetical protein
MVYANSIGMRLWADKPLPPDAPSPLKPSPLKPSPVGITLSES